jgi:hypothetical protein
VPAAPADNPRSVLGAARVVRGGHRRVPAVRVAVSRCVTFPIDFTRADHQIFPDGHHRKHGGLADHVAVGDDLLVEPDQESVPGGEAGRSRLRDNPDVPTALRDALRPVHVARDLTYRPAQRPDEVLHRRPKRPVPVRSSTTSFQSGITSA